MITIETHELESGKTRRVAIDDEAPDNPSTASNDLLMPYGPKAVAFWDFRDVDGLRKVTFLFVRRDLQGQGYLKQLAPLMVELLDGKPARMVNVIDPKVDALGDKLREDGVEIEREGYPAP